jgi:hypothetical protein
MGAIASTVAIPRKIRKFLYKVGCDINKKANFTINFKDAEGISQRFSLLPHRRA